MWSRFFIVLSTTFFVVMNVLLWRWEIAGNGNSGSPVSVRGVWEKVLTAPDFSSLEIQHRGKTVGHCRWVPSITEQPKNLRASNETPPEGMVRRPLYYVLDLSGTVHLDDGPPARFSMDLKLSTNHAWREFALRVTLRPREWTIRSVAAEEKVRLLIEDDGMRSEQVFTFSDLRNPDKRLRELGGPLLPATLAALGVSIPKADPIQNFSLGLNWEAHQDR